MDARSRDRFSSVLNGVAYRLPTAPVAVVCVDGGDPEYLTAAGAAGLIPTITRLAERAKTRRVLRFLPLDEPCLMVGQDDVACWHDSPGAPCGKVCQ